MLRPEVPEPANFDVAMRNLAYQRQWDQVEGVVLDAETEKAAHQVNKLSAQVLDRGNSRPRAFMARTAIRAHALAERWYNNLPGNELGPDDLAIS